MRRILLLTALGLLSAIGLAGTQASAKDGPIKPSEKPTCGEYGTSVHFYASPSDAAKQALKEQKLVFVLHVSGNFEDSEFT